MVVLVSFWSVIFNQTAQKELTKQLILQGKLSLLAQLGIMVVVGKMRLERWKGYGREVGRHVGEAGGCTKIGVVVGEDEAERGGRQTGGMLGEVGGKWERV